MQAPVLKDPWYDAIGAAAMIQSELPGEPPGPGEPGPDHDQRRSPGRALAVLTEVTRALAAAPSDADDAALLALLSRSIVPSWSWASRRWRRSELRS